MINPYPYDQTTKQFTNLFNQRKTPQKIVKKSVKTLKGESQKNQISIIVYLKRFQTNYQQIETGTKINYNTTLPGIAYEINTR